MATEKSGGNRSRLLRRVGQRRLIVMVSIVVLLVALVAGGTAYALFGHASTSATSPATSKVVSHTYTLSAVTSTPDAARQEVAARLISVTTPAQTKTVNASGHISLTATQARGTLTLRNWDTSAPISFPAGTVFPYLNGDRVVPCPTTAGTEMVLDATVTLPAAQPDPSGTGVDPAVAHAPGHVLQPGAAGNLPGINGTGPEGCYYYLWTNGFCHPGWLGYCHTIEQAGAFTGGQDAYNGPIVQQSDITTAANSLLSAMNRPNAQQIVQRQTRPNEQLVGTPQCAPQVSANHQAGDHAAQVRVTAAFTCTGEAYDRAGALEMAAALLLQQAAANPGGAYTLLGQIKTTVISAAITDPRKGTITLTVSASGVWAT